MYSSFARTSMYLLPFSTYPSLPSHLHLPTYLCASIRFFLFLCLAAVPKYHKKINFLHVMCSSFAHTSMYLLPLSTYLSLPTHLHLHTYLCASIRFFYFYACLLYLSITRKLIFFMLCTLHLLALQCTYYLSLLTHLYLPISTYLPTYVLQ